MERQESSIRDGSRKVGHRRRAQVERLAAWQRLPNWLWSRHTGGDTESARQPREAVERARRAVRRVSIGRDAPHIELVLGQPHRYGHQTNMPRKGAQAKAFAAQQAKKREAEKQEARAKVDAEKNNAKGISECRDVGQLMRMHRANSERIEHMEEAQEKEAKRKEAERAAKEKELEESQGKSWWDKFLPKPKGPREATSPNKVQQQRDNIEQFYDLLKCSKHVKREIQAVFKAFDANKDGSLNINEFRTYLKEPKERMPFLNRIFLTMDNDAMDGSDLGVLRWYGAFTPSTRLASIRRGRGWFLFGF